MGPRLKVDNDLFLQRVASSRNKVVVTKKETFVGSTYIVRDGDYYYYTKSKTGGGDMVKSCVSR